MKLTQFGEHITIDGYNGDSKLLDSKKNILSILRDLPIKLGMKILNAPLIVPAPDNGVKDPGGWSGFVIIAESHISIHTFPKRGFLSADIYTCKNGLNKKTIIRYFINAFKLTDIEFNLIKRGTRYPLENLRIENQLKHSKIQPYIRRKHTYLIKEKLISFNRLNICIGMSSKGYGHSYFARKDFAAGEMIMKGFGKIIDHQTRHFSVQISPTKHFLPGKWTGSYWNHSCQPSCYIKTRSDGFPNLMALKKISKGDEVTYAYYMTEQEWSKNAEENRIKCKCKSNKCNGQILSFSQLINCYPLHFSN